MLNSDQSRQIQSLGLHLRKRWSIGNETEINTEALPDSWQHLLQVDRKTPDGMPGQRLSALALISQYQLMMYRPKAPLLTVRPPFPILELPTLIDTQRATFRRLTGQLARDTKNFSALLRLMARRGFSAHPADWLPDPGTDEALIPAIYQPWILWMREQCSGEDTDVELTTDNWDDFAPAERKALIAAMRRLNPAQARGLLDVCISRESAEHRLALLQLMQIRLTGDDIEFLRNLTADRSQKVKALSVQLLSQLNALDHESADNSDREQDRLSEGFQVKKSGFLQRRIVVEAQKLKRGKQTQLRLEQLASVTFQQFASILRISPQVLASGWRFDSNALQENHAFVLCAVQSAGSEELDALLRNLIEEHDSDQLGTLLKTFSPRLETLQKRESFTLLQNKQGMGITDWLNFFGEIDIELDWQQLKACRAGRDFLAELKKSVSNDGYAQQPSLQAQLNALALLLNRPDAELALEHLIHVGMLRMDPALELLKFNVQLTGDGSGQRSTQNIQETP